LEKLHVPDDVIAFIAERIDTNIRELEGALIRLVAFASLTNHHIDLDLAQEVLKDILPPPRANKVTIARIQEVVAEYYGVKVRDLKARRRTRAIAFPRQVAMYLCRELTEAPCPASARSSAAATTAPCFTLTKKYGRASRMNRIWRKPSATSATGWKTATATGDAFLPPTRLLFPRALPGVFSLPLLCRIFAPP